MKYNAGKYDIAVIGAGHAGCEAALAAARMGLKTLLFSTTLEAIANMPCNPHIIFFYTYIYYFSLLKK